MSGRRAGQQGSAGRPTRAVHGSINDLTSICMQMAAARPWAPGQLACASGCRSTRLVRSRVEVYGCASSTASLSFPGTTEFAMADTPANALLALVPADGTQIGNQKLREQLAAQGHVLDEDGYNELRDQLVAAGKLAKGRGRGQGRLGSAPRSRHQRPRRLRVARRAMARLTSASRSSCGRRPILRSPSRNKVRLRIVDFGAQYRAYTIPCQRLTADLAGCRP